jgi:type IV pilus assembly protein PilQ
MKFLSSMVFTAFTLANLAHAEEPGMIKKVEFLPGKERSMFSIAYDGRGSFRVFQSEKHSHIIVEADSLSLPASLTRSIDASSSGSPVIQVTPYNSGSGTRLISKFVLQLKDAADVQSSDTPGRFTLEIKPKAGSLLSAAAKKPFNPASVKIGRNWSESDQVKTKTGANEKSEDVALKLVEVLNSAPTDKNYFGSRVSFEASGADIHDIFRLVGDASGLNIITDSDVNAKASYSLKDIPWDQLLDLVIQQAQLKAAVVGNVIRITTLAKFNKDQEERKKEIALGDDLEPVLMAVLPLSYAKAEDMKKMIDSLLVKSKSSGVAVVSQNNQPGGPQGPQGPQGNNNQNNAGPGGAPVSTLAQAFVRGQIEIDARSNSLVITNTKEAIERVRRLVNELDVPLPQVLIDAKFVVASEEFSRSIGMSFGAGATSGGTGRAGLGLGTNGLGFTAPTAASNPQFAVAAPDAGSNLGFKIGSGLHGNLNAVLNLSEINGTSKTVASPRVIVNNKTAANIQDGSEFTVLLPATQGGTSTTQTISANLNLSVTPQITSSGSVLLDVNISNDSPGPTTANTVAVNKKSIDTEVLVDSGSTLVLGGVYQFATTKADRGIPLLKDLPFLGQLFRTNTEEIKKSELMVFITPQVLEGSAKESDVGKVVN